MEFIIIYCVSCLFLDCEEEFDCVLKCDLDNEGFFIYFIYDVVICVKKFKVLRLIEVEFVIFVVMVLFCVGMCINCYRFFVIYFYGWVIVWKF